MMSVSKNLTLLYLLLSPYYIFKSGSIQPSDGVLFLAFLLFLYGARYGTEARKINLGEIIKTNKYLIFFVILATVINGLWFIVYPDKQFVLSTLYLLFNLCIVLLFSYIFKDITLLKRIKNIFTLNIFIQLIIYLAGVGRYYSPDRYMGTFNDPNQLAFYIFISLLFVIAISKITSNSKKLDWLVYAVCGYLIYLSGSTGMILGAIVLVVLLLLHWIKYNIFTNARVSLKVSRVFFLVSAAVVLSFTGLYLTGDSNNHKDSLPKKDESGVSQRIDGKLSKASGESNMNIAEDRGIDIMYKYPYYMILGAGAGQYNRYPNATQNNGSEIHSTASLLFYYGIVPFLLFLIWLFKKLVGAPASLKVVAIALLVESIFLINYRQPLFWGLFVLAGLGPTGKNIKE